MGQKKEAAVNGGESVVILGAVRAVFFHAFVSGQAGALQAVCAAAAGPVFVLSLI
jgi:hypothetical protein